MYKSILILNILGWNMETKEINITYEILFELLRKEKDTADLQKLESTFFNDFVDYLNEKKKMLNKEDALFSYDEKKKVEKQIDNARRIIKGIYERREKKILNIALTKSRTKSDVIDTSSFLENEKKFFDEIVKVLDVFRNEVIDNIIDGKQISTSTIEKEKINKTDENVQNKKKIENIKLVRFLYSVPKFVGKELEEYGPFEEEDIANLPGDIANILIGKGRAEEIEDN
jgi:DNA replication initiation complex subunit (GINS family)|tara:strand:- start:2919 stop:3605 length:687 start_codon:yes stop_codon:yes gene_type:complete